MGNGEVRLPATPRQMGWFVVGGGAVIEKPAILGDQAAGVFGGRIAAVPAEGRFAGRLADQRDGAGDLVALLGLAEFVMLDPAIPLAADVPIGGGDRGGRARGRPQLA